MQETAGDIRSVLAYLEGIARHCHNEHRDDLAGDYEAAIALIRGRMYGQLPPRQQISYYRATQPGVQVNLEATEKTRAHQLAWQSATFVDSTPDPPPAPWSSIRVKTSECPRQKIVGRFYKLRGPNRIPVAWERLHCGHEQMGPVGHEVLRRSRRCHQCRQEQLFAIAQKKKPASVTTAKSKAVSA